MSCTIPTAICAVEGSSVFVTAEFTDEDGADVVPGAVTWTLVDGTGTVINSREDVVVSAAASVSILLEGDDLPWYGSNQNNNYSIYIMIEALYASGSETDIPLNQEVEIKVRNLHAYS